LSDDLKDAPSGLGWAMREKTIAVMS